MEVCGVFLIFREFRTFKCMGVYLYTHKYLSLTTGWNDKIVVLKKTTLQLYFKTFIEKINSGNLIM